MYNNNNNYQYYIYSTKESASSSYLTAKHKFSAIIQTRNKKNLDFCFDGECLIARVESINNGAAVRNREGVVAVTKRDEGESWNIGNGAVRNGGVTANSKKIKNDTWERQRWELDCHCSTNRFCSVKAENAQTNRDDDDESRNVGNGETNKQTEHVKSKLEITSKSDSPSEMQKILINGCVAVDESLLPASSIGSDRSSSL